VNDLESHSRSSERPLFDRQYVNVSSYQWCVVMTPPRTVSEILPNLQCMGLPVTFRSPSFSKRQLKLQATCTCRFMCKHMADITHYIS